MIKNTFDALDILNWREIGYLLETNRSSYRKSRHKFHPATSGTY